MVKPLFRRDLRNCVYSRRSAGSSTGRSNIAKSHMARYPEFDWNTPGARSFEAGKVLGFGECGCWIVSAEFAQHRENHFPHPYIYDVIDFLLTETAKEFPHAADIASLLPPWPAV